MTQEQLSKLSIVLGIVLVVCIPWVWITISTISIVVFCVALVLLGANITGLLYWLFGKDE